MYNDLIGKLFKDGGRGPDAFDCWGLAQEVYRRNGIAVPDFDISAFDYKQIGSTINTEIQVGNWVPSQSPDLLCAVAIKNHPTIVNHVGVIVANGLMIHIAAKTFVIIDRINSPLFKNRIVGFYKYVR